MLKKTMTYKDFDDVERTEDFYFNLTKAELTELELSQDGGLVKVIEKIIAEQDSKKIVEMFKDLILKAVGEKSLDGKKFIKNPIIICIIYCKVFGKEKIIIFAIIIMI